MWKTWSFCITLTIFVVALVGPATAQFESSMHRSMKSDPRDKQPRVVDLKKLRQMSIDAYMAGNNGDLELDVSKSDVAIGVVVGIFMWAAIMMCMSWQCQKGLMREWYKLQSKKDKIDFQAMYDD